MKQIVQCIFIGGLTLLSFGKTKAQQVIATSGGFGQNSSSTLSYSLGELVIDTRTNGNTTITQGFQQPKITVTAINELSNLDFSITAFPNPTTGFVKLKTEKGKQGKIDYTLFDLGGKPILQGKLENGEAEISFYPFVAATYFIKIRMDGKEVKTFKIIKQ